MATIPACDLLFTARAPPHGKGILTLSLATIVISLAVQILRDNASLNNRRGTKA